MMELIRFATLYLDLRADELWHRVCVSADSVGVTDAVRVEILQAAPKDGRTQLVLAGRKRIAHALVHGAPGELIVPEADRRAIEAQIEQFANAAAVACHVRRRLSSPPPYIALRPESPADERLLRETSRVQMHPRMLLSANNPIGPLLALDGLADREDGTAILADAVGSDHPTGVVLGAMRLFERAFVGALNAIVRVLSAFLCSTELGYTSREVNSWKDLRGLAVHADRKENFALESDLRAPALRLEQAAYDVLFNKARWRHRSADRRDAWTPLVGTTSQRLDVFLTRGYEARLGFQALDGFSTWPMDFSADLTPHLKRVIPGAEHYMPSELLADRGKLNVRDPRCVVALHGLLRCPAQTKDAVSKICEAHRRAVLNGEPLRSVDTGDLITLSSDPGPSDVSGPVAS